MFVWPYPSSLCKKGSNVRSEKLLKHYKNNYACLDVEIHRQLWSSINTSAFILLSGDNSYFKQLIVE